MPMPLKVELVSAAPIDEQFPVIKKDLGTLRKYVKLHTRIGYLKSVKVKLK